MVLTAAHVRGVRVPLAAGLWSLISRFWPLTSRHLAGAALLCVAALLVASPLLALLSVATQASPAELGEALGRAGLPTLWLRVLVLAWGSTVWAVVAAVPLAWLVERTDLAGRGVIRWLAPLPLAIPPYVAAIAYAFLLAPGGALHHWLAGLLALPAVQVRWPAMIYGTGGAAFVLGLFSAPYIFLIVSGALARADPAVEDAARGLGCGPWTTFWHVTLPMLRPALVAGALLVFVYACVDFGVVSLLRTRTVTTAVYTYLLAGYSPPAAAVISLALVASMWLALAVQRRALGASQDVARHSPGARARRGAAPVRLAAWRWAALAYASLVLALTLAVPVAVLLVQASRLGLLRLGIFWLAQLPYLRNSLAVAAAAATCAVLFGLALAATRGQVPGVGAATVLVQAGYAIPGTVLGLALIGLLIRAAPVLYGEPASLVLAYVILFGAVAYQSCRSALAQSSPALEAAARGLGSSPLDTLRRVVLPLSGPGLLAGWALTFALACRELAASVILRPAGYDTLAVRIWVHTMDVGPDPRGAAVALLLLVVVAAIWLAALATGRLRRGPAG